ncbi:MAG TPA: cyclase family protein [Candidatus Latescibacteria bacterium]|nr:cyclase family protein [Candidatus Latescibacterota bacterium]HJP30605.1 cyclase family protein [Candidatus Latescibacterota bacterium]
MTKPIWAAAGPFDRCLRCAPSAGLKPKHHTREDAISRIVDLTHILEPTQADATRRFAVTQGPAIAEPEGKVRPEGEWYIMSHVDVMVHVGTHLETPYHCLQEGDDLATLSLDRLIGEAAILDLRGAEAEGGVTLEQVQTAGAASGGIHNGDIVFCNMGPTGNFSTPGLQWLVDAGMKMMGVSSGGVELADPEHRNINHLVLFRQGIPLIEHLAHLDQLRQSRVTVYALPIPAKGVDAFPLRVIAVEA